MVFFLQYLDKQGLAYASVFGLISDLELQGSQYSWCSSIFYIGEFKACTPRVFGNGLQWLNTRQGQLVSEYPFIYLMSRLHLTKFVGATM